MPMTIPGGAGKLSSLLDVSIANEDIGIDGLPIIFNNALGKFVPSNALANQPTVSTFNPADKTASITLSNNNYTATVNAAALYAGVRGNIGRAVGKYYLEFTASVKTNSNWVCGIANAALAIGSQGGNNKNYAYLLDSGSIQYNFGNAGTATAYVAGNVIGCAVDFGNNAIWFRVGTGIWNNNAANNPATNVGGVNISGLTATTCFPYFSGNLLNDACVVNTGSSAFTGSIPSGFLPWDIFAPQSVTLGASPVSITAPTSGQYIISGGTVSAITLTRGNAPAISLGVTSGAFSVSQGDILTITNTVVPTVTFVPLAD